MASTQAASQRDENLAAPAFVLLSFEGPDAYARAGGLGARVSGLGAALADAGYETHLFFIGSPEAPGHEARCDGRLHLHRWCQWISKHHRAGVYDGEDGKLNDWNTSLPAWLERHLLSGFVAAGRPVNGKRARPDAGWIRVIAPRSPAT